MVVASPAVGRHLNKRAREGNALWELRALHSDKCLDVSNPSLTAAPGTVLRVQPNPDGVEPWGLNPPNGLREEGPTDRVLQWVAHLYRWAMAIAPNPALEVERALGLSHSTAGRWVRMARQKGYLGPSEGPGKAAG